MLRLIHFFIHFKDVKLGCFIRLNILTLFGNALVITYYYEMYRVFREYHDSMSQQHIQGVNQYGVGNVFIYCFEKGRTENGK